MKKVTAKEAMKQCVLDAIGIAPKDSDVTAIAIELFRWQAANKDNGILTKKEEEYLNELCRKWDLPMDEACAVAEAIDYLRHQIIHLKDEDIVVDKESGTISYGGKSSIGYRASDFG